MSKISDQIRNWCDLCDGDLIDKEYCSELYALAGCIDAEMVELPRDRDGVPIHVGDTVYLDDGQKAEVISIVLAKCASVINCWTYGKSLAYMSSGISHTRPDSWERIARDIEEPAFSDCEDTRRERREIAERIRKLAEREGER